MKFNLICRVKKSLGYLHETIMNNYSGWELLELLEDSGEDFYNIEGLSKSELAQHIIDEDIIDLDHLRGIDLSSFEVEYVPYELTNFEKSSDIKLSVVEDNILEVSVEYFKNGIDVSSLINIIEDSDLAIETVTSKTIYLSAAPYYITLDCSAHCIFEKEQPDNWSAQIKDIVDLIDYQEFEQLKEYCANL